MKNADELAQLRGTVGGAISGGGYANIAVDKFQRLTKNRLLLTGYLCNHRSIYSHFSHSSGPAATNPVQSISSTIAIRHNAEKGITMSAIDITSPFEPGDVVPAMFLRHDRDSGQCVMQLPGGMPGFVSWYDLSDETFQGLLPGRYIDLVVVRIEERASHQYAILEEAFLGCTADIIRGISI